MQFLSTFISGFQDVVWDILKHFGAKKIHSMLDGAVIYEHDHFVNAGCFNNTFEVLFSEKSQGKQVLDHLMNSVLKHTDALPLRNFRSKRAMSFRIVSSRENTLTAVNPKLKQELEQLLTLRTGLKVNRALADVEFWLYSRSEGQCFFLRRLTCHRIGEKQLQKGELRPELAYFMNWISQPQKDDVFLDPFCGSGALPLARMKMGGFSKMYVYDIDPAKVRAVRGRMPASQTSVVVEVADARKLSVQRVNKIVTDPPWGYFEDCDVPALYREMLQSFIGVTLPGATMVILSAQKATMDELLSKHTDMLRVLNVYNILVSGKKAAVYNILRL